MVRNIEDYCIYDQDGNKYYQDELIKPGEKVVLVDIEKEKAKKPRFLGIECERIKPLMSIEDEYEIVPKWLFPPEKEDYRAEHKYPAFLAYVPKGMKLKGSAFRGFINRKGIDPTKVKYEEYDYSAEGGVPMGEILISSEILNMPCAYIADGFEYLKFDPKKLKGLDGVVIDDFSKPPDVSYTPKQVKLGNTVLKTKRTSYEVISCQEAVTAREGTSMENEMKSMVVKYDGKTAIVNVPANQKIDNGAVKKFLGTKNIQFVGGDELKDFNAKSGTVTPFNEKLGGLLNLIDKELLEKEFLTTNAGTRDSYVKFPPSVLLELSNVKVGEFAKKLPPIEEQNERI
jgi:prolyl-tRNA editing enzyme YbaK/EbsC (Cys-tRNA(Pro) deacylase)